MSHISPETDEFASSVPIPDIGDTTYPATVAEMGEDLTKRTRHIQNSITWNYGAADTATFDTENESLLDSLPHPLTRLGALNFFSQIAKPVVGTVKYLSERILGLSVQPKKSFLSIAPLNHGDNDWAYALIGGYPVLSQVDVGGAAEAHFSIPTPVGGFLREVTVWALPLTGITHSGLPGTMPTVRAYRVESQISGLAGSILGTVTDPSASTGAYDVLHPITLTVSSVMVQTLSSGALLGYRVRVTGEAGANAVGQGFCIAAITASFARGGG
jgi:hypothetical protein